MPFQTGVSGNPHGRPKGSKNALPRFNRLILSKFSEDDVYDVLKSLHEQAKEEIYEDMYLWSGWKI